MQNGKETQGDANIVLHSTSMSDATPHLCLWSQHNLELADNLNEGHLCLQHCKSHSNAVSWAVPKGQVSTRMTLSLLFRSEPRQ